MRRKFLWFCEKPSQFPFRVYVKGTGNPVCFYVFFRGDVAYAQMFLYLHYCQSSRTIYWAPGIGFPQFYSLIAQSCCRFSEEFRSRIRGRRSFLAWIARPSILNSLCGVFFRFCSTCHVRSSRCSVPPQPVVDASEFISSLNFSVLMGFAFCRLFFPVNIFGHVVS